MKEILFAMMLWIHNATGYTIPEPPKLEYLSSFETKRFAYGCDVIPIPEGGKDLCKAKDFWDLDDMDRKSVPLGLYDHERQVIVINKDFKKSEAHDRSVIFHELVHHMQYTNGIYNKVRCFGELEKEAYHLQNKWLQEKYDVEIYETIGINELMVMLITTCREGMWHMHPPDPEYIYDRK